VVLHEFAHGLAAYLGGDYTIRERGGLTLNPLRLIDPVYRLRFPAIVFAMGVTIGFIAGTIKLFGSRYNQALRHYPRCCATIGEANCKRIDRSPWDLLPGIPSVTVVRS
jgi:Zn-dependent protease